MIWQRKINQIDRFVGRKTNRYGLSLNSKNGAVEKEFHWFSFTFEPFVNIRDRLFEKKKSMRILAKVSNKKKTNIYNGMYSEDSEKYQHEECADRYQWNVL